MTISDTRTSTHGTVPRASSETADTSGGMPIAVVLMQSLRLVACMSAQRDNSAFPFGGSESSSTAPAGWRRRKQKPECRLQTACVRPRQLTTSASVARGGRYHPTIMFEKLRTTVCAHAENRFLLATQIADCVQVPGGEFSWVQGRLQFHENDKNRSECRSSPPQNALLGGRCALC